MTSTLRDSPDQALCGLMLVIRVILFIALTADAKHDPRLSALIEGVTAPPLALLSYGGV